MPARQHHHHSLRMVATAALVLAAAACTGESAAPRATSPAASTAVPAADPSTAFSPHQAASYEYLVPAGTGQRLDNGDTIELMPQTLFVKVGESIYIENQDNRDYTVGPFFVAAGQSLAMRFNTATVLSGQCLMNPSGEFQIIVED